MGFGSGWSLDGCPESQGKAGSLGPHPSSCKTPTDLCLSFPISPKARVEGEPTIGTALPPTPWWHSAFPQAMGREMGLILKRGA